MKSLFLITVCLTTISATLPPDDPNIGDPHYKLSQFAVAAVAVCVILLLVSLVDEWRKR